MSRRISQTVLSMIVVASLTLAPQGAARAIAVTRYVSTTGADTTDCSDSASPCATIQYAINQAVAEDTIEVAVGTYTATSGPQVVIINRNLTLSGGWGAGFVSQRGLSTIDGGNARRALTIDYHVTATVDHFAVQNGHSTRGGGINNYGGSLMLTKSRVSHNWSQYDGGGIDSQGTLVINDSTISDNSAGDTCCSGGGGGGIYVAGIATINNTTIDGNKTVGLFQGSAIDVGGTVTLNNSTVSGNSGSVALFLFHNLSKLVLNNSTVTANAGGIWRAYSLDPVEIQNSILAGNRREDGSLMDCKGTITSAGYNLLGTNAGCYFKKATGDLVGTATSPIDPRLLPLGSYGGPNPTYALTFNSPALGAGNPAAPGGGGNACLTADQRGVTRPQGARCDIGAYEAQYPLVKSVNRASLNPTSASTVKFSLTFTDAVQGVNTVAPFSDFKLITTGVTGAAISAVSGSGSTYTISVKTGSSNGTIKLNVIDDGTIHDGEGNQLGGPGPRNGSFPTGQIYNVVKTPSLKSPNGSWWDRTPTYTWGKVPAATQYQYQLVRGTTWIYTKAVLSTACGTACSATPSMVLDPAGYKWRARALANGIWQAWSPYLSFKLAAPKAGAWKATYGEFYVTADRAHVDDFISYISVYGCGTYRLTHTALVGINSSGKFSFSSSGYDATGTFDSTYADASSAKGTIELNSYYIPGCGSVTGGPFAWNATWQNGNQPPDATGVSTEPIAVIPERGGEPGLPIPAPQQR